MKTFFIFILGASLSANVVLIYTGVPGISTPGSRVSSFLNAPKGVGPGTVDNEVITMKKLILATMLVAISVSAQAQTATDNDIAKIVESVVIDNLKTVANSGATGLAVSSQAQASAQSLMMSNAVAHSARINAITERALAQTMIVGATEGAQGIKTVNEAGTTRDIGQMLGLLNAIIAGQKQNSQVVAIPVQPTP